MHASNAQRVFEDAMIQLLRLQVPDDHDAFAFAADTWLRSYRDACEGGYDRTPPLDAAQYVIRGLSQQAYFDLMRPYVQRCLRGGFLLATLEDDEDNFAGFAVTRGSTLVYIYVKKWWRRQGVATRMLAELDYLDGYCLRTWPWVDDWLIGRCIPYQSEEGF